MRQLAALLIFLLSPGALLAQGGSRQGEPGYDDVRTGSYLERQLQEARRERIEEEGGTDPARDRTEQGRGDAGRVTESAASDDESRTLQEVRGALERSDFRSAAASMQRLVAASPRRARFRYLLAYVHFKASQAERDETRRRQLEETAREEVYRTLDLIGDRSFPDNAVWVSNAEVLFDRLAPGASRTIPPIHGRVVTPFQGTGGVLLGSALDGRGGRTYDLAGKPVGSFGQGRVIEEGRDRELGHTILVRYTDANGQPFLVRYGHLRDANGLRSGMRVEASTVLGHVAEGRGGDEATLYMEIRRDRTFFDPARLLTGTGKAGDSF